MDDEYAKPQEGRLPWPPELAGEQAHCEGVVPLERLGPTHHNPPHADEHSKMLNIGFYGR
jgi:hypothetical protein